MPEITVHQMQLVACLRSDSANRSHRTLLTLLATVESTNPRVVEHDNSD